MTAQTMNSAVYGLKVSSRGLTALVAATLLIGVAIVQPWMGTSTYTLTLIYYVAYYLALGQAWNLMSGLTGYVSFCHGALAGIGTYAMVLAMNGKWPMAVSMGVAGGTAMAASLVIGATALRLRGIAFTFATLFLQELLLLVMRKLPFVGGSSGLVLRQIIPVSTAYILMVTLAIGATLVFAFIRRSRMGIRVLAIKNDELAAAALGINTTSLKMVLFCVSAGIAGLVGAVHALFVATLYPEVVFSVDLSIMALAIPLIGGIGTVLGPVVGAVVYVGIREVVQVIASSAHLLILGVLLLCIILFLRNGIIGTAARLWHGAQRRRQSCD